ncbi:hypothetical protein F5Y06DRAFT_26803 [Hypoxylon sp. FL0890]|nr:hypothetical protein F5Y06DRAFT_26803 [Hypoxylon sp. FL0890]
MPSMSETRKNDLRLYRKRLGRMVERTKMKERNYLSRSSVAGSEIFINKDECRKILPDNTHIAQRHCLGPGVHRRLLPYASLCLVVCRLPAKPKRAVGRAETVRSSLWETSDLRLTAGSLPDLDPGAVEVGRQGNLKRCSGRTCSAACKFFSSTMTGNFLVVSSRTYLLETRLELFHTMTHESERESPSAASRSKPLYSETQDQPAPLIR